MCSTDDLDMPLVWREKWQRARKEHKCCECNSVINKTDTYHYSWGVWDGSQGSFKTCLNCRVPAKWLIEECGGYVLGNLYEEILEHAQEYRKIYLYRWAVNIKRNWRYAA